MTKQNERSPIMTDDDIDVARRGWSRQQLTVVFAGAGTALVVLLVVIAAVLTSSPVHAETPAQRCARETSAYNNAWKQSWAAANPGKSPSQAPPPPVPYVCSDPPKTTPTTPPSTTAPTPPGATTTTPPGPGPNFSGNAPTDIPAPGETPIVQAPNAPRPAPPRPTQASTTPRPAPPREATRPSVPLPKPALPPLFEKHQASGGGNQSPEVCRKSWAQVIRNEKLTEDRGMVGPRNSLSGAKLKVVSRGSGKTKRATTQAIRMWQGKSGNVRIEEVDNGVLGREVHVKSDHDGSFFTGNRRNAWAAYRNNASETGSGEIVVNEKMMRERGVSDHFRALVIAHELGHAMGLEHSCEGALMSYGIPQDSDLSGPSELDKAIMEKYHS